MNTWVNSWVGQAIIGACVLWSVFLLTTANYRITTLSPHQTLGGVAVNTITVDGEGVVSATPDTIILTLWIHQKDKTTSSAQQRVNQSLNQITDILRQAWVEQKFIQTQNITIFPDYNYNTPTPTINSYTASQTISVKLTQSNDTFDKASQLIDQVSRIDGIQINGINFDIEDRTHLFSQARTLAFEKAQQKAQELAKLAGIKIWNVLSIVEQQPWMPVISPFLKNTSMMEVWSARDAWSVSAGQLDVSLMLNVVFSVQ